MTIETKLKELVLSKYKSIREFCIQNDFPYSTIDNMLKREDGIMRTGISTIIKVCNCLNIDINELENGNIIMKALPNTELSEHEKRLITEYRNKPDMQNAVDTLLNVKRKSGIEMDFDFGMREALKVAEKMRRHINSKIQKGHPIGCPFYSFLPYWQLYNESDYLILASSLSIITAASSLVRFDLGLKFPFSSPIIMPISEILSTAVFAQDAILPLSLNVISLSSSIL